MMYVVKNPTCVSFSLTRQRSLSIIFSRFTAYYSIDDIVLNGCEKTSAVVNLNQKIYYLVVYNTALLYRFKMNNPLGNIKCDNTVIVLIYFIYTYYTLCRLLGQQGCRTLKSTCDVNLLSKLSIIFKEWRVMNNVDRGGVIVLFVLQILYTDVFCLLQD